MENYTLYLANVAAEKIQLHSVISQFKFNFCPVYGQANCSNIYIVNK